jgi:hypothetical protein
MKVQWWSRAGLIWSDRSFGVRCTLGRHQFQESFWRHRWRLYNHVIGTAKGDRLGRGRGRRARKRLPIETWPRGKTAISTERAAALLGPTWRDTELSSTQRGDSKPPSTTLYNKQSGETKQPLILRHNWSARIMAASLPSRWLFHSSSSPEARLWRSGAKFSMIKLSVSWLEENHFPNDSRGGARFLPDSAPNQ